MTKSSLPLFDSADKGHSLVTVLAQSEPANAAQRGFRKLVAEIERKRRELKEWQAYGHRYARRYTMEFEPVRAELRRKQREMIKLLDDLLSRQGQGQGQRLRQAERAALHEVLMSLLGQLLSDGHDDALAALREKHRDAASREQERLEMALTESFLTDVMGIPIDDDHGASTVEELFAHAASKVQEREEERGRAAGTRRGKQGKSRTSGQARSRPEEPAARPPSPSLRAVFRKLVSALHPDREPDPKARARKNQLMQRVNQAYEAGDLFTLLGLQLEIAQIDASHLSSMTAEHLAQYSQALREQLTDINAELESIKEVYRPIVGQPRGSRLSPSIVDKQLTVEIGRLKEGLQELIRDLVMFRDPVQRRARIDQYLQHQAHQAAVMNDLSLFLADLEAPPTRARPRRRRR